jgi:hypothetical protein
MQRHDETQWKAEVPSLLNSPSRVPTSNHAQIPGQSPMIPTQVAPGQPAPSSVLSFLHLTTVISLLTGRAGPELRVYPGGYAILSPEEV